MGVDTLKVVCQIPGAKADNASIDHGAAAIGALGGDMALTIRAVQAILLDFVAPNNCVLHVARLMTNTLSIHDGFIMNHSATEEGR